MLAYYTSGECRLCDIFAVSQVILDANHPATQDIFITFSDLRLRLVSVIILAARLGSGSLNDTQTTRWLIDKVIFKMLKGNTGFSAILPEF